MSSATHGQSSVRSTSTRILTAAAVSTLSRGVCRRSPNTARPTARSGDELHRRNPRIRPSAPSSQWRGKQARHRKGVEQNQLVAEFETTRLDHDAVAVEPSREQPSFAFLIGLVDRKWRFDQVCIILLANEARQTDQVAVVM